MQFKVEIDITELFQNLTPLERTEFINENLIEANINDIITYIQCKGYIVSTEFQKSSSC